MKTNFFSIFVYAIITCTTCFGDTFWGSDFLTVNEAQKKWGISTFTGEKFKTAPEKEQAIQVAESDPYVAEGVRTYNVRTWLLATEENNYLG